MIKLSIAFFALAAVIGIMLAKKIFSDQAPSKPVIISHGVAAVIGLAFLITYTLNNMDNAPLISLIIFIVAALGGITLAIKGFLGKPGPKFLVAIHGGAAVIAFVLLLIFAIG